MASSFGYSSNITIASFHHGDVTWASWCLKLLSTWLFVQQHAQTNIKATVKAPHHWSSVRGNPSVTSGSPSQRTSNAESVSSLRHHHVLLFIFLAKSPPKYGSVKAAFVESRKTRSQGECCTQVCKVIGNSGRSWPYPHISSRHYDDIEWKKIPRLDNSLAPNRRQANIWTNAHPFHWRI